MTVIVAVITDLVSTAVVHAVLVVREAGIGLIEDSIVLLIILFKPRWDLSVECITRLPTRTAAPITQFITLAASVTRGTPTVLVTM